MEEDAEIDNTDDMGADFLDVLMDIEIIRWREEGLNWVGIEVFHLSGGEVEEEATDGFGGDSGCRGS